MAPMEYRARRATIIAISQRIASLASNGFRTGTWMFKKSVSRDGERMACLESKSRKNWNYQPHRDERRDRQQSRQQVSLKIGMVKRPVLRCPIHGAPSQKGPCVRPI